jgi:serine/threonine protein kinase
MGRRTDWEEIRSLGAGGQSEVTLVRRPTRMEERAASIRDILQSNPWAPFSGPENTDRSSKLAAAVWSFARPEIPSELGAMKVFKLREAGVQGEQQAGERLKSEIAILQQRRSGLPELLDSNEAEGWIVTEFFAEGTLEDRLARYGGKAALAVKTLRSLVETVAHLHKDGIVHRDIKPANVFVREGQLVLGDFGIVYVPNQGDRVTRTNERVGPRDYMPQWGDLGDRLEEVRPNFDVYMLGKLLWCMVAGRLKLPREYHKRQGFDLTEMFPNTPDMHIINAILDQSVVEDPSNCLGSAQQLLSILDESLSVLDRGGQLLSDRFRGPAGCAARGITGLCPRPGM